MYNAQKRILSSGKKIDTILSILAETSYELFGIHGFAVLFYNSSSQNTSIRYNDGYDSDVLVSYCEDFTSKKLSNAQITTGEVAINGIVNYVTPLGRDNNYFGELVIKPINEEYKDLSLEFIEMSINALNTFLEIEVVDLQLNELKALLDVSKVVSSTLDLNELLRKIMAISTQVMRCETSTVYMVDEATNELYFHIINADSKVSAKLQEIRLPMGKGLAGWCAQNNAPVIVPDTSKDPRFFQGADKKSGFVTRSMICVPMCHKEKVVGVLQVLNRTGDIPFNDHDLETLTNVANQAVAAIENARLYENIQKIYLSTIEVLATAIDAKDPYTQGHSRRVTLYSVAIAEQMGLSPEEVENIRYAGLLHDVGKIGIKDSIIRKPGRLTDEEYAVIKTHPSIGARILRPVDFLADKIPGVLHHHEYYDGRGYPDHLAGKDIPLMGRIICVADAFDAMTTNRPYRKGLSLNTVIGELKKFSGKQFDPDCVQAFLDCFDEKISQYFAPIEGTDDMSLIDDETGKENPELNVPTTGSGTPSSQPFPPVKAFENSSTPSSQPFPPINAMEAPKKETPSSQPFPPINAMETPKKETPSS